MYLRPEVCVKILSIALQLSEIGPLESFANLA